MENIQTAEKTLREKPNLWEQRKMEEAIKAWEKERDTAQKWVKCHIKSILHPKIPQIGTFNYLFQLIIYKLSI